MDVCVFVIIVSTSAIEDTELESSSAMLPVSARSSSGVGCEPTIYVAWVGTDKHGQNMLSAGRVISRFAAGSMKGMTDAFGDRITNTLHRMDSRNRRMGATSFELNSCPHKIIDNADSRRGCLKKEQN